MAPRLFGKKHTLAGLSLGTGSLRYIELDGKPGGFTVSRSAQLPLEDAAVNQEMIADTQVLQSRLMQMKENLGGDWSSSVAMGVPSRDVLMRIVEMPVIDVDEAREALKWDFEKYFPFGYGEAAFDIAPVDTPGEGEIPVEGGNIKYLVAAARLQVVETLLETAKGAGINVEAVEPVNVPLYRCTRGVIERLASGSMVVSVGKASSQIIVGYGDNGILYRTLLVGGEAAMGLGEAFAAVSREVSSTFTYLGSQFREMKVEEIVLCGDFCEEPLLKESIESGSTVPLYVCDPWKTWGILGSPEQKTGWEAAVGLAVRSAV